MIRTKDLVFKTCEVSKKQAMKSTLLYFALLLCIESNAQMSETNLYYDQPYVHNNALHLSYEYYVLSTRFVGLKGNIKSISKRAFFIEGKNEANQKLGRPDPGNFFYYRFNSQQEIIEAWTFEQDTAVDRTYYEGFRIESITETKSKEGVTTEKTSRFEYVDGRLVKIVHTATGGKTETETIQYDQHGTPIFEGTEYEYDQHGNWIKRLTFFDRMVQYRTMEYFD